MRAMALALGMLCMSARLTSALVVSPRAPSGELEVFAKSQDVPDAPASSSATSLHNEATSRSPEIASSSPTTDPSRASFNKPTAAAGAAEKEQTSTQEPRLVSITRTNSQTTSHTHISHHPLPTWPTHPSPPFPHSQPAPPPSWHPHAPPARHASRGGLIVGVVFGVIGGLAGVGVLLALGRCVLSWRRTPQRDRVRTAVERHYLEREMEEREREDLARRVRAAASIRRPWRAPPPPYQQAPAYEQAVADPEAARAPTPPPPATPPLTPPPTPPPTPPAPPTDHLLPSTTASHHPPS